VSDNPSEVMDAKEVKKADRFIQLGWAGNEAMVDANFGEDMNRERFGISSASGIGGLPNIEKNSIICDKRGPRRISPFFIPCFTCQYVGWIYLH